MSNEHRLPLTGPRPKLFRRDLAAVDCVAHGALACSIGSSGNIWCFLRPGDEVVFTWLKGRHHAMIRRISVPAHKAVTVIFTVGDALDDAPVRSGCVVSEPVGTDLADGTPQSGHTLSG